MTAPERREKRRKGGQFPRKNGKSSWARQEKWPLVLNRKQKKGPVKENQGIKKKARRRPLLGLCAGCLRQKKEKKRGGRWGKKKSKKKGGSSRKKGPWKREDCTRETQGVVQVTKGRGREEKKKKKGG